MEVKNFIGMDISKLTVDVAVIIGGKKETMHYQQFRKTDDSLDEMKQWLLSLNVILNGETVCCMEHTGLYNTKIVNFLLAQKDAIIWIEMPLQIKLNLGMKRGKSDKIDAKRIAEFAFKNRDEMKVWNPIDENVRELKDLLAQRDRLIDTKTALQMPLEELKHEGLTNYANAAIKLQKSATDGIQKSIDKVEKAIRKIINENETLKTTHKLLSSIVGVGDVISWHFIAYTNCFKRLTNGKQLACYCGVVPFTHDSGTSIKRKSKVSHLANKKLKTLLHMSAISAISNEPEIKLYYERKVAEGKNKMSVINAVRNKMVLRITAVIRDQRPYVKRVVENAA